MTRRYTYATTLAYSTGDAPETDEVEVEVSYTVAPGSSSEVEDLKLLSIDGVGGPFDQHDEAAILQTIAMNHTEAMLIEAGEAEDGWAEYLWDLRGEQHHGR